MLLKAMLTMCWLAVCVRVVHAGFAHLQVNLAALRQHPAAADKAQPTNTTTKPGKAVSSGQCTSGVATQFDTIEIRDIGNMVGTEPTERVLRDRAQQAASAPVL